MKRHLWLVLVFLIVCPQSFALISVGVEPLFGYERTQLWAPYRHTKERYFYGSRVTVGVLFLAGEGEFTRATSTETFPSLNMSIKDTDDRAKLGIRGTIRLLGIIYGYGRAGGQATLRKHEETVNGVTTSRTEPLKVKPYAGAGIRGKLGRNFEIFSDVTVVFANWPHMDYNDYQTAAGFTVRFP